MTPSVVGPKTSSPRASVSSPDSIKGAQSKAVKPASSKTAAAKTEKKPSKLKVKDGYERRDGAADKAIGGKPTAPAKVPVVKASAKAVAAVNTARVAAHMQAASSPRASSEGGGVLVEGGRGVNRTGGSMASESGPIPPGAWSNPERSILPNLRQNAPAGVTGEASATGGSRCGPSNLLASSIMRGPAETSRALTAIADNNSNNLSAPERTRLREISTHVDNRTTSYEELSEAQNLMYRAGNSRISMSRAIDDARVNLGNLGPVERREFNSLANTFNRKGFTNNQARRMSTLIHTATGKRTSAQLVADPQNPQGSSSWMVHTGPDRRGAQGGLDDGEMATLSNQAGVLSTDFRELGNSANPIGEMLTQLNPGQSALVRVGTNDEASLAGHWITVGRGRDGKPYIYNPDPSKGDHTIVEGRSGTGRQPASFQRALETYENRVIADPDGDMPNVIVTQAPAPN